MDYLVVDGYVATAAHKTNLRYEAMTLALDQRAFGPRRLLAAFSDAEGRLLSIAHTRRTRPPELALPACIDYLGALARRPRSPFATNG